MFLQGNIVFKDGQFVEVILFIIGWFIVGEGYNGIYKFFQQLWYCFVVEQLFGIKVDLVFFFCCQFVVGGDFYCWYKVVVWCVVIGVEQYYMVVGVGQCVGGDCVVVWCVQ